MELKYFIKMGIYLYISISLSVQYSVISKSQKNKEENFNDYRYHADEAQK